MKYIINGGNKISGTIQISGNKNAVFPCVAAALLTKDEVILENIPDIRDTQVLIEILERIGVSVTRQDNRLIIQAQNISHELPKELIAKLRGSIVLVGAILARCKQVSFSHPGGDLIGKRGIEAHLEAFAKMGAKYTQDDLNYFIRFNPAKDLLKSKDIFLPERSVTATENIILLASTIANEIKIRNCASEPHVVDLCNMLVVMGVDIQGIGTDTLIIKGKAKLSGVKFRIREDYIEIGTYAIIAAIACGSIRMENIDDTDLDPVLLALEKFGLDIKKGEGFLNVSVDKLHATQKVITNIWPGFPTDLMSALIVLATQAKGVTLCHDWMFESRMFFTDKLMSMGAKVIIADPHRVLVYGPTSLKGRDMESPDIRAGMALVLAALVAKGQSVVHKAELIERGYENVVAKLQSLGASIESISD